MPPAFFLRPLGRRLWFRRFGCVTSPGVLRGPASSPGTNPPESNAGMVPAANGFVIGWAVLLRCASASCPHSGHGRFHSLCGWWKALKFCGSCSPPGVSGEFMSAVWTLVAAHPLTLLATTATNPVKRSPGVVCKFERSRVAVPFAANYDLMLRCTEKSCYGGVAELAVIVLRTHHRGRRLIPGPQPPCPQARSREKEAANRPASPDLPGHARREREQAQWDLCRAIR